ncbi:hypothetical protein GCM10027174_12560 [Salinifilum aidingensis]
MTTNTRPCLVLHLTGGSSPIRIALDGDEADLLADALEDVVTSGQTRSLTMADGNRFLVNFGHVATAHIEASRPDGAYGAPSGTTGF